MLVLGRPWCFSCYHLWQILTWVLLLLLFFLCSGSRLALPNFAGGCCTMVFILGGDQKNPRAFCVLFKMRELSSLLTAELGLEARKSWNQKPCCFIWQSVIFQREPWSLVTRGWWSRKKGVPCLRAFLWNLSTNLCLKLNPWTLKARSDRSRVFSVCEESDNVTLVSAETDSRVLSHLLRAADSGR